MYSVLEISLVTLGVVFLFKGVKENVIYDEATYRATNAGRDGALSQQPKDKIRQAFAEVGQEYRWWPLPIKSKR